MEFNFPEAIKDDLMFLNTVYHRGTRDNDYSDMVEIVYKEISTGEKSIISIENPKMDIYVAKPEFTNSFYREYMPLSQVDKVSVPYKDLEHTIAKMAGPQYTQMYFENLKNRNRQANKNLHKWENVYGSDYDIEQWIRIQWMLHLNNEAIKRPTKGYLDIEVDTIELNRFPEPGEVPINAVTLVDSETKKVYTLLLRNSKNPLIQQFEDNIDSFIPKLHSLFDETYGEMEYLIYMYDENDELGLIRDMFRIINMVKLDFVLIWNMDFDIPYIIERIKNLGADPAEVMSHRDFKRKVAYYQKPYDAGVVVNRSSRLVCSSYTTFACQMTVFAGMRKGQGELPSLNLNAVGKSEIGDEKIDYSDNANISTLPYVDYETFVVL